MNRRRIATLVAAPLLALPLLLTACGAPEAPASAAPAPAPTTTAPAPTTATTAADPLLDAGYVENVRTMLPQLYAVGDVELVALAHGVCAGDYATPVHRFTPFGFTADDAATFGALVAIAYCPAS